MFPFTQKWFINIKILQKILHRRTIFNTFVAIYALLWGTKKN